MRSTAGPVAGAVALQIQVQPPTGKAAVVYSRPARVAPVAVWVIQPGPTAGLMGPGLQAGVELVVR